MVISERIQTRSRHGKSMLYFTAMRNTKYILIAFLIISLMAGTAISLQASTACDASNITNKPEAELKEYLQKCEEEAAKAQAVLNQTKTEVRSIDGVVKTLQTKITSAEKTIKNKNSLIVELGSEIRTRQARIEELEADIARGKESLAELIRRTNEVGDYTLAEVFLNTKNLSEFYVDIDNYTGIKAELELYFSQIRETQLQTEGEKTQLSEKQNDELDAKYIIEKENRKRPVRSKEVIECKTEHGKGARSNPCRDSEESGRYSCRIVQAS